MIQTKKWTRSELTLKPGLKNLAEAVIRQWHIDGEPECDIETIYLWKKLLETCEALNGR